MYKFVGFAKTEVVPSPKFQKYVEPKLFVLALEKITLFGSVSLEINE